LRVPLHFDEREFQYPQPSADLIAVQAVRRVVPEHRRHARLLSGIPGIGHLPHDEEALRRIFARSLSRDQGTWATFDPEQYETIVLGPGSYVVLIEGVSSADAQALHASLLPRTGYRGALQVLPTNPVHLVLYLHALPPRLRLVRDAVRVLHTSFEAPEVAGEDNRDWITYRKLEETQWFQTVDWEDTGVQGTIFDPFDVPSHSEVVGELEQLLATQVSSVVDEVLLRSAALDPRIAETLHAALDLLEAHRTREQLAQVALSCRRLLERLADALFPPRPSSPGGRELGQAQYRNRLWAYVDERLAQSETNRKVLQSSLEDIGTRVDRLDSLANKGLHAQVDATEVQRLLVGLVVLAYDLLLLSPVPQKAPEEPYRDSVAKLMRELFAIDKE
jgi:hypothetical protein